MLNIILCGAPGTGKGTHSDFIAKKYGLQHLSTGDVLRAEIQSGSALGKEIDAIISKGNLVPDAQMIALIEHFLDSLSPDCKGVIFDGFPRTIEQAKALTQLLAKRNMEALMLDMYVKEEEIVKRLLERAKVSHRADDNYDTIKHRLQVFHEVTAPVCYYYMQQRNYFIINANYEMKDTFSQIDRILQLVLKSQK